MTHSTRDLSQKLARVTHPQRFTLLASFTFSTFSTFFTFFVFSLLLTLMVGMSGCVVKSELGGVYNQGRLGLERWALSTAEAPEELSFNVGYLIGIEDQEGIGALSWRYELMTPRKEVIASFEEEMRAAEPNKQSVFVQGVRARTLTLPSRLPEGERLVLWFTLTYKDELFHEQLFAVQSGAEGADPTWLEDWINNQNLAIESGGIASGLVGGGEAESAGAEPLSAGAEPVSAP